MLEPFGQLVELAAGRGQGFEPVVQLLEIAAEGFCVLAGRCLGERRRQLLDAIGELVDVSSRFGQRGERAAELVEVAPQVIRLLARRRRRELGRQLFDPVGQRFDSGARRGRRRESCPKLLELAAQRLGPVVDQQAGNSLCELLDTVGDRTELVGLGGGEGFETAAELVEFEANRVGVGSVGGGGGGRQLVDAFGQRPQLLRVVACDVCVGLEPPRQLGQCVVRRRRSGDGIVDACLECGDGVPPGFRGLGEALEPLRQRGELLANRRDGLVRDGGRRLQLLDAAFELLDGRIGLRPPGLDRLPTDRRMLRQRVRGHSERTERRRRLDRCGQRPDGSIAVLLSFSFSGRGGLIFERVPQAHPGQISLRDEDLSELPAADLLLVERLGQLGSRDEAPLDEDLADRPLRRRLVLAPLVEHPRELPNGRVGGAVLVGAAGLVLGLLKLQRALERLALDVEPLDQDLPEQAAARLLLPERDFELFLRQNALFDDQRADQACGDGRRVHACGIGNPSSEL